MNQSKENQQCMVKDVKGSYESKVMEFYAWLLNNNSQECFVWSKGNIDIPIIMHVFDQLGIAIPFDYRKIVDLRSELLLTNVDIGKNDNSHNALSDAEFQARQAIKIIEAYNKMNDICITQAVRTGNYYRELVNSNLEYEIETTVKK